MSESSATRSSDPPKVASIKRKRYGILEKRLDKFKRAKENRRHRGASLETIEDVTKYDGAEPHHAHPTQVTSHTLVQEVEETQATVEESEGVFSGSFGTLDAEDFEAPPSTRPI